MAVIVDKDKCTGVSRCVEVCPVNAITCVEGKAVINDECIECGVCVSECLTNALSMP